MFTNFIYLIVVLLIYTTYQPSEETNFPFFESIIHFLLLTSVFAYYSFRRFRIFEIKIASNNVIKADHDFNAILSRQSILSIVLFAIDIYVLNLPSFFFELPVFSKSPTLLALVFLSIFIFYLSIIWACAYNTYQKLYKSDFSRKSYILSNINFSVPFLLPWIFLTGIADLINILPFDLPKKFLSTTYGEISYFIVFLFFIAILGPAIIQKFWQCKPLEVGDQRKRIEAVCKKAGLGFSNILNWPILSGRMITAGVMGLVKRFRYILVTKALLRYLEPEEIDAVIAHEIGHIKKYHLIFYLIFFAGFLLFSYSSFYLLVLISIYLEPYISSLVRSEINPSTITSVILTLFLIINFIIYFRFIFGYFMRNFERQADTYVYSLFDTAQPLISTFKKIVVTSGQSPDKPNWHHFSITERVHYLNKCESDRIWIKRHDRKVRYSIWIFFLGALLLGFLGYHLNFGHTGQEINVHFFEKILLREIEKKPNNADLYNTLGDIYYQNKYYKKTIEIYEKSISISEDNPHALNNLAWLFATCEDIKFRNPKRALDLALKAANIEEKPHILDTLAESYYVNGMYKEAVETELKALGLEEKNQTHYEEQLKKFKEALGNRK